MSESRLNIEFINSYSEDFSQKVTEDFFKTKKTITGQEILNLTPVKQVNYFILKNLFTKWQAEMVRLESPYFDYQNEEVKKSLQSLMNVLSQNILINESHIPGLVKSAVLETLQLILSPYDFYQENLKNSHSLTIKYLRSQAKYIRINKHLYMRLLEELEEVGESSLSLELALEKLNQVLKSTNEAPEDIEQYIEMFASISPLKTEDFFIEDNILEHPEITEPELTETEEQEISDIQHDLFQDFEEMDEAAIEKSKQQLNDRYSKEEKTINDSLATETVDIATAHASKPVESIHQSISVNQKYMFVKELFEGESEQFDEAITAVEDCETFEDAVGLLVQKYAKNYHWDMQSVEIKDFLKVIIKKFK